MDFAILQNTDFAITYYFKDLLIFAHKLINQVPYQPNEQGGVHLLV